MTTVHLSVSHVEIPWCRVAGFNPRQPLRYVILKLNSRCSRGLLQHIHIERFVPANFPGAQGFETNATCSDGLLYSARKSLLSRSKPLSTLSSAA